MTKPSKTKIIHLVSDLGIGGVQKVVLDICSSANLAKYDVSIVTLNNDTDLLQTYKISPQVKIKTFSYQYSTDYSLKSYIKYAFFPSIIAKKSSTIINYIAEENPDILHVHIHPKEVNIGILVQKKINCKIVYTQHITYCTPKSITLNVLGIVLKHTYNKYHLIAVSKSVIQEIKEDKFNAKNKLLFLIENKLNLALFKPQPKKPKDYISVVYVARIGSPKAHKDLIEAWSMIDSSIKKKLFLVGPDGLNNQIQELAKKIVPDDSIVFMGAQFQIAEILNECDFAVFPSHKEGLPIALLEKMAMKLPVIVSDIKELTDIVEDGKNGLVFKCGNPNDLAGKISILLKDANLRKQLGKKARQTVEEKFGSNNIALDNEKAYEEILKLSK